MDKCSSPAEHARGIFLNIKQFRLDPPVGISIALPHPYMLNLKEFEKECEAAGMTSRERFLAAVNHRVPDRIPQLIRLGKEAEKRLGEIYGATGPELEVRIGNDAIVCSMGINAEMEMSIGDLEQGETYINEWGVKYERRLSFYYPVGHPLHSRHDLNEYRFPDPHDPKKIEKLTNIVTKYGSEFVIIADLSSTLFEAAAGHIRGMEQFLIDCYEDPVFAGSVLDGLADYYSVLGIRAIHEGADIIRIGDDVGSQHGMLIHPKLWRGLVRPRLFRMIQTFKQINPDIIILFHSCGDFRPIIPDLIDIGVRVISSMQEVGSMNFSEIKREFGGHLAFKGGLDTQYLLPMGTPEDVREGVMRLIRTFGADGGYIFMPSHLLYGDVPLENIWSMFEALKDYGKYPLEESALEAGVRRKNRSGIPLSTKDKLEAVAKMVENGEARNAEQWTRGLLQQGIAAREILAYGLEKGMQRLAEQFGNGDVFLPEILMGNKALRAGAEVLRAHLNKKPKGVIVLGMVRNDLHDIGKNIVKIMFEIAGFRVIDLGVNVLPEVFVSAVEREKADILALSIRMSTTLTGAKEVVELLKKKKLKEKVKVMVGGAPTTPSFADEVGADGFAADGVSAAEKALELMGLRRTVEIT
jgi:uroporphyrinogen decarboxylase